MIKEIKYVILKIREKYYRSMWCKCIAKSKKCECEIDYKQMYIWKDKANIYLEKQRFVNEKIRGLNA